MNCHALGKACSTYNKHVKTRSTAETGGAKHPPRGPPTATERAAKLASLRYKTLQGLHELQNHLMLVVHVLCAQLAGLSREKLKKSSSALSMERQEKA